MTGNARPALRLAAAIALTVSCGCIIDMDHTPDGPVCEVDGHVWSEAGSPIGGVKVRAYMSLGTDGDPAFACSTSTDSRGSYSLAFATSTSRMTLIPSKPSCVFRPPFVTYSSPGGSLHGVDFTGYCGETHRIDGHVLEEGGEPVGGVVLAVRDQDDLWNKTVLTDEAGYYFADGLVPGLTYVVTPTRSHYRFEPASRTYENLSQSLSGQDYVAIPLANHPS
jgi:hypothetical protein